jgi:hypothetical protein
MLSARDRQAIALLAFYSKDGFIGYAHGGEDADLPTINHAIDRGWIVFDHDASIGGRRDPDGRRFQQRDIYRVTDAGKAMLTAANVVRELLKNEKLGRPADTNLDAIQGSAVVPPQRS